MPLKRLVIGLGLGAALPFALHAQYNTNASPVDIANLREDINGLDQRLADLSLRVEQLENRAARSAAAPAPGTVTQSQLAEAVASLSAQIADLRAAVGKLTAVPAAPPSAAAAPAAASFSHEGVIYTVKKGDTLALIAKKTGAKFQDIVNANRLQDPSHIVIGQQLFIPGGK